MPEFRGYDFNTVYHAVDDLGLNNDGTSGSGVHSAINSLSGGEAIIFPDGDYYIEDSGDLFGSQGGAPIGVIAEAAWDAYQNGNTTDPYIEDGTTYDDIYTSNVNFQPDPNAGRFDAVHVANGATLDIIVEGITLDHTVTNESSNHTGIIGIGIRPDGDADVRNIDTSGRAINYNDPGAENGQALIAAISARGPSHQQGRGNIVVHSCDLQKIGDESLYGGGAGMLAFQTGYAHKGGIVYSNCSASEVGNNGFYCSGPINNSDEPNKGAVTIDGCYAENCGSSGFRISGGNSTIKNSEAVYDSTLYSGQHRTPGDGGSRPIVIETSSPKNYTQPQQTPGATIENTTVTMRDCHKPSIAIHAYQTAREVNIINCDIDIDGTSASVVSPFPLDSNNDPDAHYGWITRSSYTNAFGSYPPGEDPRGFNIDDTTIKVQNVPSDTTTSAVVSLLDADNSSITNSCIESSGNNRTHDGVVAELYSTDYSAFSVDIQDSTINVGGNTTENVGGNTLTTSNIDTTGTCTIGDNPDSGSGTAETFSDTFTSYLNSENLFNHWTTTWNSSQSDWSVQSDANFVDGSKLVLDAGSRTRHAIIYDDAGTTADVEVAAVVMTPDTYGTGSAGSGSHVRPIVRGSTSASGDETGYFVAANDNEWRLLSYNGDGTTTQISTWGNPAESTMYRIRLRANADTISAKTWPDGEAEPSAWDAQVTDTKHSSGWCGLGSFEAYDEFGYIGVGTGGATAPMPGAIAEGVPVTSAGDVVTAISGIMTTVSTRAATEVLIDSFENYTDGNLLYNEAAEWGQVGTQEHLQIQSQHVADGTLAAGILDSSGNYKAAQSNTTSGTATGQSATFSNYPYADCTIRCAFKCEAGQQSRADIMFGVPSDETDANSNCYRIRGGTSDAPFIRSTIAGSSTEHASFSSTLTDGNWYDFAIQFEDAGTDVNISCRVWEWDSTNSEWVEHESEISAAVPNDFAEEGGVALAVFGGFGGAALDYLRFYEELGRTEAPIYTP